MTNKDAIKYLIAPIATSTEPSAEYLKQKEAYELAIKALEERPQGDLTEAEKTICKIYLEDLDKFHTCNEYKLLMNLINNATTAVERPQGDLISRSALKNELNRLGWTEENGFKNRFVLDDIIDNTPTVEAHDTVNWYCDKDTVINIQQKRPQGEWKRITQKSANIQMFICSICGRKIEVGYYDVMPEIYYPFCHCGADMRKGE